MQHIGIDFEYHTNSLGEIDHLICVCATDDAGHTWQFWLRDGRDTERAKNWLSEHEFRSDVCFIAHALDIAEGRCLASLFGGIERAPKLQWRDTFHEGRLLDNSFRQTFSKPLSLAEMCRRYLGINIDLVEKEQMRMLCIDDNTEGFELPIMTYCLHDTQYLPRLAEKTLELFTESYNASISFPQGRECDWKTLKRIRLVPAQCETLLMEQAKEILCFRRFAQRGLPVNAERVKKLVRVAGSEIKRMQTEFNDKYPGAFTFDLDGTLHRDTKKCQEYLQKCVDELDGFYPRTPTGQLATSCEVLSKYFKHQDNFGGDVLHLQNMTTQLQGISGGEWTATLDGDVLRYGSLEPFGSTTGRCAPKPSRGFVFGWSKNLYGVLEPPEGLWIVELDFSAEETAIMAILCKDASYEEVYAAKDTYLWFCDQLGLIPHAEFVSLSASDLKAKYKDIRKKIKTFSLAWGYGAGAKHLAELAEIPLERSIEWKRKLEEEIFSNTKVYKDDIIKLCRGFNRKTKLSGRCGLPFSFPDGWLIDTAYAPGRSQRAGSETAGINAFFQGWGAYILRQLAIALCELEDAGYPFQVVATIHDAIAFVVRENDYDTISKVRSTMQEVADALLEVPRTKRPFMRVGEPEIIRHGEIWCPEADNIAKFNALMDTKNP